LATAVLLAAQASVAALLIDLSICDSCSACSKSFRLFTILLIDLSIGDSFAAAAQDSGYLLPY
jgi:hypothetical protein